MSEFSEVHERYIAARNAWLATERDCARARAILSEAERARKTVWDKLVTAAAVLPAEDHLKEAIRQFRSPQESKSE